MLDTLVLKIQNKVANWKGKLLSQGGRLILIHYVPSCIAIYTIAVLPVPDVVIKKINFVLSTFLWERVVEEKKGNSVLRLKCVNQWRKGYWHQGS